MTDSAASSGTQLAAKLGIKGGARVLMVGVPEGWPMPTTPPGATVDTHLSPGAYDVVLLFCPDHATLAERFAPLVKRITTAGALWVAWPKRASGVATDLTDNTVRKHGLKHGLVDVKVAAVDSTWSGLKFVRRLKDR